MTFGGQVNESDAARITGAAIDAGINFIDTANVYTDGRSESILDRVLHPLVPGPSLRGQRPHRHVPDSASGGKYAHTGKAPSFRGGLKGMR